MHMRSRPCSCGSGRPARGCCGRFRRVGDRDAAAAYLARQARPARDLVGPFSVTGLAVLQAEAAQVAGRRPEFGDALRGTGDPVGSDVRRVVRAVAAAGGNTDDPRTRGAIRRADSPMARAAVARAWMALREAGRVDEHLAAAAMLDLVGPRSQVIDAAVLQAARPATDLRPEAAQGPRPEATHGPWPEPTHAARPESIQVVRA
jgi:hypothetical protein